MQKESMHLGLGLSLKVKGWSRVKFEIVKFEWVEVVFQRYQYGLHTELGQKGLLLGRPRFANHVKRALNINQHFYDGMVQQI